MNKYAIIYYLNSWSDDKEDQIQKILLKYKELIPKRNKNGVIYLNIIKGISVISSKGPEIIEFIGDKYKILTSSVLHREKEYELELSEGFDKLFEAKDDDDAKLIFEVSDDNI